MGQKSEFILSIPIKKGKILPPLKQMKKSNPFNQRWICMAHVLPSTLEEYYVPGVIGAFVSVVADAESAEEFEDVVRSTLEGVMCHPVLDINEIEVLAEQPIAEELRASIEQLLPVFPIAYGLFYYYENE
jgi:hypothetical protein